MLLQNDVNHLVHSDYRNNFQPIHLVFMRFLLGQEDEFTYWGQMHKMFFQQGCEGGGLVNKASLGGTLQPSQRLALQVALLADRRLPGNKAKDKGLSNTLGLEK